MHVAAAAALANDDKSELSSGFFHTSGGSAEAQLNEPVAHLQQKGSNEPGDKLIDEGDDDDDNHNDCGNLSGDRKLPAKPPA